MDKRQGQTRGRQTIVVIDDEWIIRMTLAGDLSDLGYACHEARDGEEGLALLRQHPDTALLVTDVALPGALDGFQVAATARSEQPALKVLFITGDENHAASSRAGGDAAVLIKPFTAAQLTAEVDRLLREAPR